MWLFNRFGQFSYCQQFVLRSNTCGLPASAPSLLIASFLPPVMDDAARPTKEDFGRIPHDSYNQCHFISETRMLHSTPILLPWYKTNCTESAIFSRIKLASRRNQSRAHLHWKKLGNEPHGLLASEQSAWGVSGKRCRLDPKQCPWICFLLFSIRWQCGYLIQPLWWIGPGLKVSRDSMKAFIWRSCFSHGVYPFCTVAGIISTFPRTSVHENL